MTAQIEKLEQQLDSFNVSERKKALEDLLELVNDGNISLLPTGENVNLHFHTFYSYNACGYSPAKIVWLARKSGLRVAGMVDFDVLDGLEEFLETALKLDLKACAGMESRVFFPEFGDKVINSPGEPGIAYHVGMGFTQSVFEPELEKFKKNLFQIARQRNQELVLRINDYLSPLELNYEKDVVPLTPSGNATERHISLAYARKACTLFNQNEKIADFWSEKLTEPVAETFLPESVELLNLIRKKTMKQGGVGYVIPDTGSFPGISEMNNFILAAGAIPTLAWLDGAYEGEKDAEKLLETAMSTGVEAVNIVPARNYIPGLGKEDCKCQELYKIVNLSKEMHLPVIAGTEMNSPGQKFVNDFQSAELKPLLPVFTKGAYIVYAHSVLQLQGGLGYTSTWADKNFRNREAKNNFFSELGELLQVKQEKLLTGIQEKITPNQILKLIRSNGEYEYT